MEDYSAPPDYYDNEEDLGDDDAKVKKKLKAKTGQEGPEHAHAAYECLHAVF